MYFLLFSCKNVTFRRDSFRFWISSRDISEDLWIWVGEQAKKNERVNNLRPVELMTPWDVAASREGLFTYHVSRRRGGEGSANADDC